MQRVHSVRLEHTSRNQRITINAECNLICKHARIFMGTLTRSQFRCKFLSKITHTSILAQVCSWSTLHISLSSTSLSGRARSKDDTHTQTLVYCRINKIIRRTGQTFAHLSNQSQPTSNHLIEIEDTLFAMSLTCSSSPCSLICFNSIWYKRTTTAILKIGASASPTKKKPHKRAKNQCKLNSWTRGRECDEMLMRKAPISWFLRLW